MTQYFAGYPIAGSTRHFLVTYSDENNADQLSCAQAVLGCCEADLQRLQDWFNCNYDQSDYGIWVMILPGKAPGSAGNYGYDEDKSAIIEIEGSYQGSESNASVIRDERACMLFVAELAEILMDFTPHGWNRGNNAGEALSRVAAAVLHPLGYYLPGRTPTVNQWLQLANRRSLDFITNSENTDNNALSFGQGILFIYYLVSQLGFSYRQVCTTWGAHLCETYANLTGQPSANAFGAMCDLLDKHLPAGAMFTVPRDNVFRLYDPPHLSVLGSVKETYKTRPPWEQSIVSLKAGPRCEEQVYSYSLVDITSHLNVQAYAFGMAFPQFTWTVNGKTLSTIGKQTFDHLDVVVNDTTPRKDDVPFAHSLPVVYKITNNANGSLLEITNQTFPGNIDQLEIKVKVNEKLVPGSPQAEAVDTEQLRTRGYQMEPRYTQDVYNCNWHPATQVNLAKEALLGRIFIIKNTPDPAPDELIALTQEAQRYAAALDELTGGVAGLREAALAAANIDAMPVFTAQTLDYSGIPGSLPIRMSLDAAPLDETPPVENPPHNGQISEPSAGSPEIKAM